MSRFISSVFFIIFSCYFGQSQEPSPSQKIDQLVEASLAKQGIKHNADITDDVFLRRAYLNIAGRVPTIEEAESFQTDHYRNKRERLIDQLLNSEAYVSNTYHFWADLLRMNGEPSRGALGNAYELWVKEAIRKNMPYDEMVYSLVTAEGKFWDNGAVGYYFRDRGMPLDNMSNTVRVFLGTRLECAQCHNHPFDKWTQMDYFKMASFSYGMNTKNYDAPNRDMVGAYMKQAGEKAYLAKAKELTGKDDFPYFSKKESLEKYLKYAPETTVATTEATPKKEKNKDRPGNDRKRKSKLTKHETLGMTKEEFAGVVEQCIAASGNTDYRKSASRELLNELYNPLQYLSVTAEDKNSKLPHDYQYSDAHPNDAITADTMFGEDIDLATTDVKIQAYGKWMTSSKNPTFSRVIANRLWKEVFGIGIFEPVDELTDHTFISNPELLAYLEELMVGLKYDMRAFQEILYNTKTYQRASFAGELEMGTPYYFQGPLLRRMSAEQIWDSLVSLALPEADRYQPRLKSMLSNIDEVKRIYRSLEERPFDEYMKMIEELAPLMTNRRTEDDENRAKLIAAKESGDDDAYQKLRKEINGSKKDIGRKIAEVAYIYLKEEVNSDDLLLAMGIMDVGIDAMMSEDSQDERKVMTKLPKADFADLSEGIENKNERRNRQREQKADYSVYKNLISDMARASELESPAKRGHFLRDFGQSDREVIENASDHASVPQALNLLNGPIVQSLTNRYSVFGNRVHVAGSTAEKTKMIFQAMLTRQPSADELTLVEAEVAAEGEKAFEGIVWALLNTQQFMFIQ